MSSINQLAASTPEGRDRYVDLLRVGSLGVVVIGHWLMAVVVVGQDGVARATNVLSIVPRLQPLTWLLQVMPVFFMVGGFSHATAWRSVRRRGGRYADFVRSRAGRLLRPTAAFIAVWLVLALGIEAAGADHGVLRVATRVVAQPLWFLGVYLGIVALAPAMLWLHERCGRFAAVVPLTLGAAAVGVDVARFGFDVPLVGFANVAFVWLAVHQVGFLYADGMLRGDGAAGRLPALVLTVAGLAGTILLTSVGPYPVSMVGVPGERISNMSPPTAALLACSTWLIGLVSLARGPVSRWLRRPRVWCCVIAANTLAMTTFLWHLTALFALSAAALALHVGQPAVGSAGWWLLRPAWVAALLVPTAILVTTFRRADLPRPGRTATARTNDHPGDTGPNRPGRTLVAAAGMVLCTVGVLGLSAVGFGGILAGRSARLVVVPVTPLSSVAILALGAAMVLGGQGLRARRRYRTTLAWSPAGRSRSMPWPIRTAPSQEIPAASSR